ncbi:hypothetical protein FNV43_RR08929 [Rhamnella rubrinervis]|uniref:Uncharacterized protein n=1 Tax=Rhamnella rubrinervis TaxID=2594499 RepID=A0A8K0H933_9ROSA|nr:hypothetical protein FNV43_RR08929 [Rhamnella rubrinervis]
MAELSVEAFLNSLNELLDIVPEKKVDELGIVRVFGNKITLLLFDENTMKPVAGEAPAEIFYGGRKTLYIKLEPKSRCLVVGMKRVEPISKSVFDFKSEPESESRKVVGLKDFLPGLKHMTFEEEAQEGEIHGIQDHNFQRIIVKDIEAALGKAVSAEAVVVEDMSPRMVNVTSVGHRNPFDSSENLCGTWSGLVLRAF